MYFNMHACVCRVCQGVVGGVDSWWMVTSQSHVVTGIAKDLVTNLQSYQRENHLDKHLGCGFRVKSVVIITACWLLINLMTQMSRKEILIINISRKNVSMWGNACVMYWLEQKLACVCLWECVWIPVGRWCFLSSQCNLEPVPMFAQWWNSVLACHEGYSNLTFSKATFPLSSFLWQLNCCLKPAKVGDVHWQTGLSPPHLVSLKSRSQCFHRNKRAFFTSNYANWCQHSGVAIHL